MREPKAYRKLKQHIAERIPEHLSNGMTFIRVGDREGVRYPAFHWYFDGKLVGSFKGQDKIVGLWYEICRNADFDIIVDLFILSFFHDYEKWCWKLGFSSAQMAEYMRLASLNLYAKGYNAGIHHQTRRCLPTREDRTHTEKMLWDFIETECNGFGTPKRLKMTELVCDNIVPIIDELYAGYEVIYFRPETSYLFVSI